MLLLLTTVLTVIFIFNLFFTFQRFSNDLPIVSQLVYYIKYLLGLLRHSSKYFQIMK